MPITTLELRGRDLVIIPTEQWQNLSLPALLLTLFGTYLPAAIRSSIVQDKRHGFLRVQPIHFSAVKQALERQQVPFTVTFDEMPALSYTMKLALEPRPYQEEALVNWLAEGSRGVVVLPTGAGKTFVAALAIAET
ncbi:MAG: DEAD/DEAH box helicase family protein, partial [Chloroflexota bacterium]|nr:DEAD/DEAH box helicase family protein [Chloroflexota bacterium]